MLLRSPIHMKKRHFIICTLFLLSFTGIAQSKLNDTIGGIILSSHRYHRKNSPFIRFKTIMYFVNIEDKYVLKFDGFQAVMDAKIQSISMVDSVIKLTYLGFNRKLEQGFTETITYDLRDNKCTLQRDKKRIIYIKPKCEFTEDQAWYMIPE